MDPASRLPSVSLTPLPGGTNPDVEATAAPATQAAQASQYPSGIRSAPVDAFFGRVYGDKYIGSWVFPPLSVVSASFICHEMFWDKTCRLMLL